MLPITQIDCDDWHAYCDLDLQQNAIQALEHGRILILPKLAFALHEHEYGYLNPAIVCPKTKNISYDLHSGKLKGYQTQNFTFTGLKGLLERYANYSQALVQNLFPSYVPFLQLARTSLRPVEVAGRQAASYRKDDTRLHVDAFPANPNQGKRLLRVFTNINPEQQARVWRVGEPFSALAKRYLPYLRKPWPQVLRKLLKITRITKSYRTNYDHYMLQLHDTMKADLLYQQQVPQTQVEFLPGTTWIVYTDQVSHAAISGQHVLEQTLILPVEAMQAPELAPIRILANLTGESTEDCSLLGSG